MDRSPAHEAARLAACRLPALNASLALLGQNTAAATCYRQSNPIAFVSADYRARRQWL